MDRSNAQITFREIVQVLDLHGPIYYVPRESLNRENLAVFRVDEKWEQKDTEHNNCGGRILLPDIDVYEYYQRECERNPSAIDWHIRAISNSLLFPYSSYS